MDIQYFKARLFEAAAAAGFSEYELYCQNKDNVRVDIFNQEVSKYENSTLCGISFRAKYNGKMGYASSELLNESVIEFLINAAKDNAVIVETDDKIDIYEGDNEYPNVECFDLDLEEVGVGQIIDAAISIEKAAKEFDSRVKNMPYCFITKSKYNLLIANSKGMNISKQSNNLIAFAYCQVQQADEVKMNGEVFLSSDFKKLNPKEFGEKGAQTALDMLGVKPIKTGTYDIVIDAKAASSLLSVFFSMFSAEFAQKGFSLLEEKIGDNIASDVVTIVDNPLLPYAVGSTPFDSEGVASFKKYVVQNGVFKTFLHNTKTAKKAGVASTGNATKQDHRSSVGVGPTNFYIEPSEKTKEQLLVSMGNGLIIDGFAGLHSGTNPISGEFSLQAEGHFVENGNVVHSVEQITLSGNFLNILSGIVSVADDLELKGSITSPSIFVKGMSVSA